MNKGDMWAIGLLSVGIAVMSIALAYFSASHIILKVCE